MKSALMSESSFIIHHSAFPKREARSRWLEGPKSKWFEQIMWELEMASSRMSSIIVIRLSMRQTSLQSKDVSSIDPVMEDNHNGAGNTIICWRQRSRRAAFCSECDEDCE